jgi:hypothetical protein
MDFEQINDQLEELADELANNTTPVPAESVGLDYRCGLILVGEDFIASASPRLLDYFGGFEYIQAEHRRSIGSLTIYSAENDRVLNVLEAYETSIS